MKTKHCTATWIIITKQIGRLGRLTTGTAHAAPKAVNVTLHSKFTVIEILYKVNK